MSKCRECGSEKLIPNLGLRDHFGDAGIRSRESSVRVEGAPEAWVFKDAAHGGVSLTVCGECGHAEVYVGNARELWEKYEQARRG